MQHIVVGLVVSRDSGRVVQASSIIIINIALIVLIIIKALSDLDLILNTKTTSESSFPMMDIFTFNYSHLAMLGSVVFLGFPLLYAFIQLDGQIDHTWVSQKIYSLCYSLVFLTLSAMVMLTTVISHYVVLDSYSDKFNEWSEDKAGEIRGGVCPLRSQY